jgi:hypothetical protein
LSQIPLILKTQILHSVPIHPKWSIILLKKRKKNEKKEEEIKPIPPCKRVTK